jgi:hypothetical protein
MQRASNPAPDLHRSPPGRAVKCQWPDRVSFNIGVYIDPGDRLFFHPTGPEAAHTDGLRITWKLKPRQAQPSLDRNI